MLINISERLDSVDKGNKAILLNNIYESAAVPFHPLYLSKPSPVTF